ncbi:MAG: DUF4386 domain-containing protein [Rhodanobacter sp.]
MTFSSFNSSQRSAAKVFGLIYLPFFVLLAAVNFGILEPLSTGSDPAQIARNILTHEMLFRVGLVGVMLYSIGVLVLSISLYVILKPVSWSLALFATFSRFAHGFVWLLVVLNLFTALRLLSHPEYAGLPADQLPVFARLYLSGFDQYYVGLLFWSLASGVGAYLWLKSSYIHRALAAFGILASAWCIVCTIILFVFPDFSKTVNLWWFDTPMVLFEIALSFLLLFRGLRARDQEPTQREAHA